jgi:hypothetical protein
MPVAAERSGEEGLDATLAISMPTIRAPSAMTLASLCSRARRAETGSLTVRSERPGWRFTAIECRCRAAQRHATLGCAGRDMLGELVAEIG